MIKSIYVKNFVLIDEINLDFNHDFSCFTGETGAGKSLLIDAISILCGGRVSTSYIQKGANSAFIEAIIEVNEEHPSLQLLKDAGFDIEDETFTLSREFNIEGKSSAKINRRSTTLSFIREVMSLLIDIHSQHDTQYLLNPKYHLQLLDEYVNDSDKLLKVKQLYKQYTTIKKERETFEKEEANPKDLDYLMYQLNEMESITISEEGLKDLEDTIKEMSMFEKTSASLREALSYMDTCKYENLYDAGKLLSENDNETIVKIQEEIMNAYYLIDEQKEILSNYLNSMDFDEREFDDLQQQLFDIRKVLRKHGNTYSSFIEEKEKIEKRIHAITNQNEHLEHLRNEEKKAYNRYLKDAKELSLIRKEKARFLKIEIEKQLQELVLKNAKFEVSFENYESSTGIDKVEFKVSMNAGEDVKPLAKVASGGELSRLMLGLKSIFTSLAHIETVIFDEIDNGVSGSVANAIGMKMHHLAKDTQVFSVTHLSPVAVWANTHYLVKKQDFENRTTTKIEALDKDGVIHELAMISQGNCDETSLNAAKTLYESIHKQ